MSNPLVSARVYLPPARVFRVDLGDLEHFRAVLDALAPVGSVEEPTAMGFGTTAQGDGVQFTAEIAFGGRVAVVYPSETTSRYTSMGHDEFRAAVGRLSAQVPVRDDGAVRAVHIDTDDPRTMVPVVCELHRLGRFRPTPPTFEHADAVATITGAEFTEAARAALSAPGDVQERHVRVSVADGFAEFESWGEGGYAHGRAKVAEIEAAFTVRMPAPSLAGFLDLTGGDVVSLKWSESGPYEVIMQCGWVNLVPVYVSPQIWDEAARRREPTAEHGQTI